MLGSLTRRLQRPSEAVIDDLYGPAPAAPRPYVPRNVTFDADSRTEAYEPARDRVDRLSFVWWSMGPDDSSPMFLPTGSDGAMTLVAVWPTDRNGGLDLERLRDVKVTRWDLTSDWFGRARERHRIWPLGRHDVLVSNGELIPCRDSVWTRARAAGHPVAGQIDAAVRQLAPPIPSR